MNTFEDKLHASSKRLMAEDNKRMHVPQNPLSQKRNYWGWVATPAAAVVGVIFGMSVHLIMDREQDVRYALQPDTVRVFQAVHDTLYMTQVVEKEKIVVREAPKNKHTISVRPKEEPSVPVCSSVQCDDIDYSVLAFN